MLPPGARDRQRMFLTASCEEHITKHQTEQKTARIASVSLRLHVDRRCINRKEIQPHGPLVWIADQNGICSRIFLYLLKPICWLKDGGTGVGGGQGVLTFRKPR